MKRTFATAGLLLVLLAGSAADAASFGARIHLQFGDTFLQVAVPEASPRAVVYDEVVYERVSDRRVSLIPETFTVPVTRLVTIPAHTDRVLLDGEVVAVTPRAHAYTQELLVRTETKVVYTRRITENVVYVPTLQPVTVYHNPVIVRPNYHATWVRPTGTVIRDGHVVRQFDTIRPPDGVVSIGGVFRFKKGQGAAKKLGRSPIATHKPAGGGEARETTGRPVNVLNSAPTARGESNRAGHESAAAKPSSLPTATPLTNTAPTTRREKEVGREKTEIKQPGGEKSKSSAKRLR